MRNSSRRLAVATSIALAVSSLGGVALASEATDATQPAALEVQTQETVEPTAEEAATEAVATGAATNEAKTDESATEKAATGGEKPAEEKADATETDDVALEAMVAEYYEQTYHRDTREYEYKAVDESGIEWVPVDVSKYSSDEFRYVDEDGYRIYYYISHDLQRDGLEKPYTEEWVANRVKIGENGEFLAPATDLVLRTDHTSGYLKAAEGFEGATYVYAFMDADVPQEAFTQTFVDKNGKTVSYYPGGEYGPAGFYYRVTDGPISENLLGGNSDRYRGMYVRYDAEGGSPFSGTSSAVEGKVETPQQAVANIAYTSPTVEATIADTAVAADTTAAAAKATPETGDPTSLAGAATTAVAALGAFVSAKAMRRK